MLAILVLLQAAAPAPPPVDVVRVGDPSTFDLATYRPREAKCADVYPLGEDVLVCARMADMPRSLDEQAAIFEPRPFRPAWRMLGGEGGVQLEQRSTLMSSAPAAMAHFKLKF